jgi:hypothetical protein
MFRCNDAFLSYDGTRAISKAYVDRKGVGFGIITFILMSY